MADWSKNKRFSAETYFYLEYHKLHGKSISVSGFSFLYSEGESATKAAFQTGYWVRESKGFGIFPTSQNRKWVLICCACSLLKTEKGRERNGKEAKNQNRANRCKKSSVSGVADARSYNSIRQDALSFCGKLWRQTKLAPQSFAANSEVAYWWKRQGALKWV